MDQLRETEYSEITVSAEVQQHPTCITDVDVAATSNGSEAIRCVKQSAASPPVSHDHGHEETPPNDPSDVTSINSTSIKPVPILDLLFVVHKSTDYAENLNGFIMYLTIQYSGQRRRPATNRGNPALITTGLYGGSIIYDTAYFKQKLLESKKNIPNYVIKTGSIDPTAFSVEERLQLIKLKAKGLSVGYFVNPPWAYECANGKAPCMKSIREGQMYEPGPGIAVEYTDQLCNRLGVQCEFIPINTEKLNPEIWSPSHDYQEHVRQQLVLQVHNMTLPTTVETESRELDFTTPLLYMQDGLLMRPMNTETELVAQPFPLYTWAIIVGVFVAMAMLDLLIRVFLTEDNSRPGKFLRNWLRNAGPNFQNSDAAWMVGGMLMGVMTSYPIEGRTIVNFGLFFQRGVNINVNQWSRRILYGTIGLASIIICAMYSAFLVSHRVATKQLLPVNNMADLVRRVESREYKLLIDPHSQQFLSQIRTSRNLDSSKGVFRALANALQINPPEMVENMTAAVERVNNKTQKVLLYSSQSTLRAHIMGNCNVSVIALPVINRGSFAFLKSPPGPPIVQIFNKLSMSFRNFDEQERKYRFTDNCHMTGTESKRQIKVHSMEGTFILLGCGCLLAVLTVAVEVVSSHLIEVMEKSKVKAMTVDKRSMATSVSTERENHKPRRMSMRRESKMPTIRFLSRSKLGRPSASRPVLLIARASNSRLSVSPRMTYTEGF